MIQEINIILQMGKLHKYTQHIVYQVKTFILRWIVDYMFLIYGHHPMKYRKLRYCKSTKFGVLFNLADLALGQKLNRII